MNEKFGLFLGITDVTSVEVSFETNIVENEQPMSSSSKKKEEK